MKNFTRTDLLFSLCGLNCGLCPMFLDQHCPGCGGGAGNQSCRIARCSLQYGVEYCYQCSKYPCENYQNIDVYDFFISHRNQLIDMEKAKVLGSLSYQELIKEKADILSYLLNHYNAGRQKSFFCIAVNLLDLKDIKIVMERINGNPHIGQLPLKEKASIAVKEFQTVADSQKIVLKLNKKPKNK